MEPEEAIPTGDDNSIGPAAAPAAQQAPSPQGDDGAIPEGPVQDQGATSQTQQGAPEQKRFGPLGKIVSYLMGEGAVHPQVLQQAAQQIDPESGMSASDRNLMVVEDAAKRGGPDAAWKIVQANRVAYNAKQAFAYAALNGNQQKQPDVHAAVDAANQAADHVLDGSNARFMVSTGGQITATVKGADGQPQVFDLNPDQFRQYLNVGGAGQYDKQMQKGGIARTLTNITQNQQRVSSVAGTPPMKGRQGPQQAAPQQAPQPQDQAQLGGKVDGFGPRIDPDLGYSPQLQRRANAMFPPGAASDRERQDWMSKQQGSEDAMKNKVDVAEATGESRENVAKSRAGSVTEQQRLKNEGSLATQGEKNKGWQYAADAKRAAAQIIADQKAAQQGNKDAQSRIESARKMIATKRMSAGKLTPEDEALEKQLTASATGGGQQQQAPQRQAPAQQQANPGTPPVAGARFYKGQWYTRGQNGEAVPVQQ